VSLARWDLFGELRRMREEMDRMFEGPWRPRMPVPWTFEGISPVVDVYERDNNVVVKAEVPGLKKEDLEVAATEDSISLRGEVKCDEEVKEEGFYRHERRFGKFCRTIPMPAAIKPDEVKASFKEGILEVTAPKAEAAKAKEKKVPIEA